LRLLENEPGKVFNNLIVDNVKKMHTWILIINNTIRGAPPIGYGLKPGAGGP